jgi:phosphatidylethanolamine/phosphatidyl-N-methylethanolamine N-methyltransferase
MVESEDLPHESRIYSSFAHFYDRIFTNVFSPRIFRVVRELEVQPGETVLEVGVGTGLSLGAYPEACDYLGVDLAPEMLAKAEQKAARAGLTNVRLEVADALALPYDDDSFDYVTSFHVVSVVPDAQRMVQEMLRVCRPGGTIAIINHFRSPRPIIAKLVDQIDPVTRKLGWRTTLSVDEILDDMPLRVERRYKTSTASLFTVLIGEVQTSAAAA